jgi:hypothetical protein
MHRISIIIDIYCVCSNVDRREFGSESGVNVTCYSHRQLTLCASHANCQLCSSTSIDLE